MFEIIYVLLSAAQVGQLEAALDDEHRFNLPECLLSVTWNVAHTQALVKAAVRQSIIDQYGLKVNFQWWSRANHDDVFAWFNTPEWQAQST